MKHLKFKLALLMLALVFTTAVSAQGKSNEKKSNKSSSVDKGPHAFTKGGLDWNLGLGFGLGYGWGRYSSSFFPPINTSLDYGVHENVSVGLYLAYTQAKYKWVGNDWHQGNYYTYSYTYKYKFYIAGVRGAYHFGDLIGEEKLDVYAGLMLGNAFLRRTYTYEDPYKTRAEYYNDSYDGGFVLGLYGGGRYFFSDKIGVYGEFGWGVTYGNIGLTIKLK